MKGKDKMNEEKTIPKFIITLLFGWLGVHKFMAGKTGMGFLYLLTFGLFGIGWIIDTVKSFPYSSASQHHQKQPLDDFIDKQNYTELAQPKLREEVFTFKVEHNVDFPKYPNEDTDIPGETYVYDKRGNFICRADGENINDADAAYLVRNGYDIAKEVLEHSSNPKFHRTESEEELKFQFFYKYGNQSQKLCNVFHDLADQAYLSDDSETKILLLQQCTEAYEAAKQWHYNKSKGAMLWFQDYWEHCHNSKSDCFAWIDGIYSYIDQLIKVRDVITPWILKNAENGFLQTDIYKAFPEEDKTILRKTISKLADQGKICKVKKGSTYFLSLPHEDL